MFPNDLVDDEEFPALEVAVMLSLLRFYNKEQQRAWPSIKHLAKINGLSHVCVIRILRRLEEKGYIRAERKNGCVTKYEVFTSKRGLPVHDETDKRDLPVNDAYRSTTFTAPVNDVYCTSKRGLPPPVNDVYPINTNDKDININTNDKHKDAPSKKVDFAADFEEFWRAYPKPQNPDKTPGRKKYIALREKGVSAEELLKAAQGYAQAMRAQRTAPRYIKRCATFLGPQEPWKDFVDVAQEQTGQTDGPPDASKMFPNLAAWWRRNQEASDDGAERLGDVPGIP